MLTEIVRQKDLVFMQLLNEIRVGKCSPTTTSLLGTCLVSRKPVPDDGILPTKLSCTNADVDAENKLKLRELPGEEVRFRAHDSWANNPAEAQMQQLTAMADKKIPRELLLKVGAQVMLGRNMQELGLVNGSRGIVESFESETPGGSLLPVVRFDNDAKLIISPTSTWVGTKKGALVRTQLPLKLAWSLTVHKSQGMTLTRAELSVGDAFDFGQVYVALSRVVSLEGLFLKTPIGPEAVKAHHDVLNFYSVR
jgi:ATP-dependent DNA helicase PIF1